MKQYRISTQDETNGSVETGNIFSVIKAFISHEAVAIVKLN